VAQDDGIRGIKREVYEFWSSDLLELFDRAGVPRKLPPPYLPDTSSEVLARAGHAPPAPAAFRLAKPRLGLAFSDMAAIKEQDSLDAKFYKPADAFFSAYSNIGLTFDDVTLATLYSEVLPRETQLDTHLADGLHLNIPIISSDMDTVTESRMAIAMALNGALGLIHYNMSEREQLSEVSRVKNHVQGLIQEPISVFFYSRFAVVITLIYVWTPFVALPIMANMAEIVRGAVQSIPTGQWEAARSLAFSRRQTLWLIVLPQCIKRMLPPWMNWYAILTMATTLASIVGVAEMMTLTGRVTAAEARTDLLIPIYIYVLLWFFAYCYPIARWTRRLEARYAER
jgi:ABC-type amino acid transport system permease subunit